MEEKKATEKKPKEMEKEERLQWLELVEWCKEKTKQHVEKKERGKGEKKKETKKRGRRGWILGTMATTT